MRFVNTRWACMLLIVGVAATTGAVSATTSLEGRWKSGDGDTCYWDPSDTGPDQCQPTVPPAGRWKLAGDNSCYLDTQDSGPDQCTPAEAAEVSAVALLR